MCENACEPAALSLHFEGRSIKLEELFVRLLCLLLGADLVLEAKPII